MTLVTENGASREAVPGKLKIFLGYASGVGKTRAMLEAAHRVIGAGVDVVVGHIAPGFQAETTALLEGIEQLPPRVYSCEPEFDLDAALQRRPRLLLLDDLAHRNGPGCRHLKRYQDVEEVLRSEELRAYLAVIGTAVGLVCFSLLRQDSVFPQTYTTEEAFRHSLFQVASLMTTAGYTTTDYAVWLVLAVTVLVIVMFIGAMAGSTAGGIKVSRIVMALKGACINVRKLIDPLYVPHARFEGKTLGTKTINDVFSFIVLYSFILLAGVLLLSFDPVNGRTVTIVSDAGTYHVTHGFMSNFSAVLTCISNVGPAFEAVGPYSSFAGYNGFSTIVLTVIMLLGRLEILPVLILLSRRTWQKA